MDAKELYDVAYNWFQGNNVIPGADDPRAVFYAKAAQDAADEGDYQTAIEHLLRGVWYAGRCDGERDGVEK